MADPPVAASIRSLLDPAELSDLIGAEIVAIEEGPLAERTSAWSGSGLSSIRAALSDGSTQQFVLKRISAEWDYFMRATDDRLGREATVWQVGLLDQLPPEIGHTYAAVARDGEGWALLMRDIAPSLVLHRGNIALDEHEAILDGLAAMHAAFWESPSLADAATGLCPPDIHYSIISPATARRNADAPGIMPLAAQQGWDNLARFLPGDLYDVCLSLSNDPTPLVAALRRYPMTLVHGDARISNIAVETVDGRPRLTLIDWAIAGVNSAQLDLIWYLSARTPWLPAEREAAMDVYRDRLRHHLGTRFDPATWLPMLELSILGGLIRFGWFTATAITRDEPHAHDDLRWWAERARAGVERL